MGQDRSCDRYVLVERKCTWYIGTWTRNLKFTCGDTSVSEHTVNPRVLQVTPFPSNSVTPKWLHSWLLILRKAIIHNYRVSHGIGGWLSMSRHRSGTFLLSQPRLSCSCSPHSESGMFRTGRNARTHLFALVDLPTSKYIAIGSPSRTRCQSQSGTMMYAPHCVSYEWQSLTSPEDHLRVE